MKYSKEELERIKLGYEINHLKRSIWTNPLLYLPLFVFGFGVMLYYHFQQSEVAVSSEENLKLRILLLQNEERIASAKVDSLESKYILIEEKISRHQQEKDSLTKVKETMLEQILHMEDALITPSSAATKSKPQSVSRKQFLTETKRLIADMQKQKATFDTVKDSVNYDDLRQITASYMEEYSIRFRRRTIDTRDKLIYFLRQDQKDFITIDKYGYQYPVNPLGVADVIKDLSGMLDELTRDSN